MRDGRIAPQGLGELVPSHPWKADVAGDNLRAPCLRKRKPSSSVPSNRHSITVRLKKNSQRISRIAMVFNKQNSVTARCSPRKRFRGGHCRLFLNERERKLERRAFFGALASRGDAAALQLREPLGEGKPQSVGDRFGMTHIVVGR